jgi:hypothetical protein
MNSKLRTLSLFTVAGGLLAASLVMNRATPDAPTPTPVVEPPAPIAATPAARPVVQIALLLDTSGSMNGLIEQAKSQLWRIVNQFGTARRDGARPRLQIALYEYGNSGLSAESGWIRRVSPFTEDLDALSEALFGLSTNGGDEFCGLAVRTAVTELDWSPDPDAVKLVFVAGNEEFDQGPVAPKAALRLAADKGITVNTIYCGAAGDSIASGWRAGAAFADGRFLTIDHNAVVAHVDAPQDDEIARLGGELNETYVPFGRHGATGSARQQAQDSNAHKTMKGTALQRSISKSSAYYSNATWDLVDAVKEKKVALDALDEGALPAELRGKSESERAEWVKLKAKRRVEIQTRINKLAKQRAEFVAAEKAKSKDAAGRSLDVAVVDLVKTQGSKKGLRFE